MQPLRQVALLIETSRAYGRGLLRGVAQYQAERGRWMLHFEPHGLGAPPPRWLKGWRGDGVLARVDNRRMSSVLLGLGVPVVNLRSGVPDLPFPFLGADNGAIVELAAEHLIARGLRRFAFCGFRRGYHPGLDHRGDDFRRRIEEEGFECHTFRSRGDPVAGNPWELEQEPLDEWIDRLPKPIGIMSCNDDCGLQVLNACRRTKVHVPDHVAVIGVDNDECLCQLCTPPLTSIDINSERVGYEAAAVLDRLMAGRVVPGVLQPIKPRGVVARPSTDVLTVENPLAARAIRFIRERACQGLQVGEVYREVGASKASLAPQLRRALGRTVHQEIHRVRIERAKDLLTSSGLEIKEIAREAGFGTVQYLTRVFRAATGETPARFRRRRRR